MEASKTCSASVVSGRSVCVITMHVAEGSVCAKGNNQKQSENGISIQDYETCLGLI